MRVGIVSPMFPPLRSGSSHYAYRLAEGLTARGHDVFVISSSNGRRYPTGSFSIMRIPSLMLPPTPLTHNYSLPFGFFPLNYPLLKSVLSKQKPDLIHVNGHFLDLSLLSMKAASSLNIPSVLTIHTRLAHANQMLNPLFRAFDRSMISQLLSSTASIIALDRQMYRYIKSSYHTSDEKITTIPLGIDIEKLHKSKAGVRFPRYLEKHRVIASLTHITALKTPKTLLYAFSEVKKSVDNLKLLLIGSVNDPRVHEWIEELKLDDDVILMGAVDHDMIPSLLRSCVLEAHSLDFRTGLDNAAIEAMALGLPVISCVREDNFMKPWLRNWDNVVLVKPKSIEMTVDAMGRILGDERARERIGANAAESAQTHFSLRRMLDDIEELYYHVLS